MRLTKFLFKPKASEVLTAYLKQCNEPPWTSYFVKWHVENDQVGQSNFNWTLDTGTNYHILRTGCFPYLKYHCSKEKYVDLTLENMFFGLLKFINLAGVPMLLYGLSATCLISHKEVVNLGDKGSVPIYFLYKEDKGSRF